MRDMITAIVQAGIDGGAFKESLEEMCLESKDCIVHFNGNKIYIGDGGLILIRETSIEKLIFNPDFMRAIWGEDRICTICGTVVESVWGCDRCGSSRKEPAFRYHQMQAIKLSDGNYIQYLYERLPKGEGDE